MCVGTGKPTHTYSHTNLVRILASVLTLLCMDFSMPLWKVMFSFVAMAILERERQTGRDEFNNNGVAPGSIHQGSTAF